MTLHRRTPRPLAVLLGAALIAAGCSADPTAGTVPSTAGAPSGVPTPGIPTPGSSEPTSAAPELADSTTPTSEASAAPTPSSTSSTAPAMLQPSGDPATLVAGLEAPWSIVFVAGTALVSERDSGRILQLNGSEKVEVGTVDGVVHQGEGGLLGLATTTLADTTYLYAYFTSDADNRIVRYPLTGIAAGYGLGPVEPIFSGIPKAGNHDGGRIAFGPDGMLYVTSGDAGQSDNAQDPDSLSGKILRLNQDGTVPADNPRAGNPMYSMGHRNPQGIAWDADGRLWAAEFGQNTWDELNLIEAGANYGWPVVEGISDNPDFVNPLQQWATDDASPSGIAIAGGSIFIANLKGERLRSVPVVDPAHSTDYYVGGYGRLRDAVVAPDGTLWVLTNNTDGRGDPLEGDDRILGVTLVPAS